MFRKIGAVACVATLVSLLALSWTEARASGTTWDDLHDQVAALVMDPAARLDLFQKVDEIEFYEVNGTVEQIWAAYGAFNDALCGHYDTGAILQPVVSTLVDDLFDISQFNRVVLSGKTTAWDRRCDENDACNYVGKVCVRVIRSDGTPDCRSRG